MIFARYENEKLIFCPNNGYRGNIAISNLPKYYETHPEEALADGWLEFIPCDEESENGYTYAEYNGKLIEIKKDMEVT